MTALREVFIIQYSNIFNLKSKYIAHSIQRSLWILLGLAGILYRAILFDVVGDQRGWQTGCLAVGIMLGWILILSITFEKGWKYWKEWKGKYCSCYGIETKESSLKENRNDSLNHDLEIEEVEDEEAGGVGRRPSSLIEMSPRPSQRAI